MMDLSMDLGTNELSKDSEGFVKCRTHQNKDGVMVPDTPTREKEVIVGEDDLGSEPAISLEALDEESETIQEVSVAKVGPSAPVTLASPIKRDQEIAGGGGHSAPVILATTTTRPGTVTIGGAVNVL